MEQIELSKEDIEKISEIGGKGRVRYATPATFEPKWSINVFDEEVEKKTQTDYRVKLV